MSAPVAAPAGFQRRLAASCVLADPVSPHLRYVVIAGGSESATTLSPSAAVFVSSNGAAYQRLADVDPTLVLGRARYNMAVASNDSVCAFVGGATGVGKPSANVDIVTVRGGTWRVTHAADLRVPRELARAVTCEWHEEDADGVRWLAIGGLDSSGNGISAIEWAEIDATRWTIDTSATGKLHTGRGNFALASDGDRYIVAGGLVRQGYRTETIEAIDTRDDCDPYVTDLTELTARRLPVRLADPVEGNEGFVIQAKHRSDTSVVVFAGGRTGTATAAHLSTNPTEIIVNWKELLYSTPSLSHVPPITGTYRPMLAVAGGNHYLVGGSDATETHGVALVQQHKSSSWISSPLREIRHTGVAAALGDTIYLFAGVVPSAGFSSTIEKLIP